MDSLGAFEQLILFCAIRLGEGASGVAIRETLEERTGRAFSSGAIYTALSRLEERGLVTSWVGEPTAGRAGRPPRYYRVEREGSRALLRAYSTLQSVADGIVAELNALAEGEHGGRTRTAASVAGAPARSGAGRAVCAGRSGRRMAARREAWAVRASGTLAVREERGRIGTQPGTCPTARPVVTRIRDRGVMVLAELVLARVSRLDSFADLPFFFDFGLRRGTDARALGLAVFSSVIDGARHPGHAPACCRGTLQHPLRQASRRG